MSLVFISLCFLSLHLFLKPKWQSLIGSFFSLSGWYKKYQSSYNEQTLFLIWWSITIFQNNLLFPFIVSVVIYITDDTLYSLALLRIGFFSLDEYLHYRVCKSGSKSMHSASLGIFLWHQRDILLCRKKNYSIIFIEGSLSTIPVEYQFPSSPWLMWLHLSPCSVLILMLRKYITSFLRKSPEYKPLQAVGKL